MKKSDLKVITVLGTRPEIIRLACTMQLLDKHVDHKIVHTGQNYDFELNEVFFNDLGIRKPDFFLNVDTSSLGAMYAGVLKESEAVFKQERPDAVLILGDTNSAIAAIMARRMKIPVYHMEAGNRCFDMNVPEETNRRIVDHISDFNLVYTEHARRNLLNEGLHPRRIYLTGSPMGEVLAKYMSKINASKALEDLSLERGRYFLVSLHREENVDSPENLGLLIEAMNAIAAEYDLPVVVSTHPRTRKRLEAFSDIKPDQRIRFMKPFGFIDYNWLQKNAICVISDSGTICEESAILGFPAITPRTSIERPESMDAGTILVTGLFKDRIVDAVGVAIAEKDLLDAERIAAEYRISNCSQRVLRLIVGTARLSHKWDGIFIMPPQAGK